MAQHQPFRNTLFAVSILTARSWLPRLLEKVIFLDKVSFKKYKSYGALIGGSGKVRSKSIHFYLVLISQTICAAYRPLATKSAIFAQDESTSRNLKNFPSRCSEVL